MAKTPPIKYTSRDFESIKKDLINYAKVYYPETYKDFNDASFGSLLFDMVAYVGDIISFYADYQVNETFIDSAIETKNILRLAKQLGYKYPGSASSSGICAFYVAVPASGNAPDLTAVPVLKKGSALSSDSGASFILNEDVDFSSSNTQIVVAEVDTDGVPTSYAYKAYGEVVSGEYETEFVAIGEFEKFMRLKLGSDDITEIVSVFDVDGHEYFEVDYLSQNIVYKSIRNRTSGDKENAPYILREMTVPRRFTVEHTLDGETYLQFGYGSSDQLRSDDFPEPSSAVLNIHAKKYYSDSSFDPNLLMKTEKFGIVPPPGTMVITFRKNSITDVNVAIGAVNKVSSPILDFPSGIVPTTVTTMRDSIEVSNEELITGQTKAITVDELRVRAVDAYAAQNRAVTKQDYLSLIYRMPASFGSIKRANIMQDKNSFKRNLNLFIVSEDENGFLTEASQSLKGNLKTWINKYKMINDTVDILDGKIANIGIEFEVVGTLDKNKIEVLSKAMTALKTEYSRSFAFGTPFYISDVYRILNDLPEVIDTTSVKIVNKRGSGYSTTSYDVSANTTGDKRFIKVPEDVVLEIRYPDQDIIGAVV